MAVKVEEIKIFEKVLNIARKELNPVEYAKFIAFITPKVGDSVKEIRKFRNTISEEEFMRMVKKKGAKIVP